MTQRYVKQGGSFSQPYTMVDASGNAVDISGYTLSAEARLKRNPSTTQTMGTVADDLANGDISVTLTPTLTAAMGISEWEFDAKAVSADTLTVYHTPTEILNVQDSIV